MGHTLLEVRLAPPALRKRRADLYVDLSAVAKGYAVDQVAALLEATGHRHYLVEVGGELRAAGRKGPEAPWRVVVGAELATMSDDADVGLLMSEPDVYCTFKVHRDAGNGIAVS